MTLTIVFLDVYHNCHGHYYDVRRSISLYIILRNVSIMAGVWHYFGRSPNINGIYRRIVFESNISYFATEIAVKRLRKGYCIRKNWFLCFRIDCNEWSQL